MLYKLICFWMYVAVGTKRWGCSCSWRHQHSTCRGGWSQSEGEKKKSSIFPTKLPWQISNRVLHSCWMIIVAGLPAPILWGSSVKERLNAVKEWTAASPTQHTVYIYSFFSFLLCFLNTQRMEGSSVTITHLTAKEITNVDTIKGLTFV